MTPANTQPTNPTDRARPSAGAKLEPHLRARRIVHLQPVQWKEGWPLMGADGPDKIGEPVLAHRRQTLPEAKAEALSASDEITAHGLDYNGSGTQTTKMSGTH